jgi:HD-like signal output (HDOD) protein
LTVSPDVLAGIPALPAAVSKVLEETGKDEPDARVLTKAIESDAGLASKMLTLVNSPYYGLNGTVSNLGQAVVMVGMRQVRNVALAVGALRSIPGIPPAIVDRFLDQAMVTAKVARGIATTGGLSPQEADTAHLGGLLRGVGSLVALRMGERNPSDVDIAKLSRIVLEFWNLPTPIIAAVGDSAGDFPVGARPSTAAAVHLAALVTAGRPGDACPQALAAFRLQPDNLTAIQV